MADTSKNDASKNDGSGGSATSSSWLWGSSSSPDDTASSYSSKAGTTSSRDCPPPYIGERVLLRGTGSRWMGGSFRATVVDCRPSDDTVKVRYDDGGYKRFPMQEFFDLNVGTSDQDGPLSFGTKDFEWADDQFNLVVTVESEIQLLRDQLREAIRKRDFLKAQSLKEKLMELSEAAYEINVEEGRLLEAIRIQDFLAAHEIQQKIEAMQAKQKVLESNTPTPEAPSLQEILNQAAHKALRGGLAGATAMVVQVTSLMWMRTTMNYQYRHGHSTFEALRILYADGGVRRFYRGILPALAQGPLSRFGDTAANAGMLALFASNEKTRDLPIAVQTLGASLGAASFRIFLMPLDTIKTMMQVEGKDGLKKLMHKAKLGGPGVFYHGAIGASAATFAGHYPWFATYNTLDSMIPVPEETVPKLARNAFLGFSASAVSDTTSNSLRVLKTFRQTSEVKISYIEAAKHIIDKDGMTGLFGRGLKTRLIANGTQGLLFSVLWKYFDGVLNQSS